MRYRLSGLAETDLLTILLDGIDRFGVAQALAYREGLERSLELIGEHPRMGRIRHGIDPPLRVVPSGRPVILYEEDDAGGTVILRIRSTREDWVSSPL